MEELAALRTAARLRSLSLTGKTDQAVFEAISKKMPSSLRELCIEWPGKGLEELSPQLLRRTRGFDVFDCPCGGRRRVLALVTHPDLARKILGLPSHPRTRPLPTGPPQLELPLH